MTGGKVVAEGLAEFAKAAEKWTHVLGRVEKRRNGHQAAEF